MGNQLIIVAVVLMNEIFQLFDEMFSTFTSAKLGHVHEYLNGLLNFETDHTDVDRLLVIWQGETCLLFISLLLPFALLLPAILLLLLFTLLLVILLSLKLLGLLLTFIG